MGRKKSKSLFLVLLLFAIGYALYLYGPSLSSLSGATVVNQESSSFIAENGSIELYFCPHQGCEETLVSFLESANVSIHCALYDIGLPLVQQTLREKAQVIDVKVITDDDYFHKFDESFVKPDKSGLMHNKFCIVDSKHVSTGSMNPTNNDAHKNNNNLLIIESTRMAQLYDAELLEMWGGKFKGGNKSINNALDLNGVKTEVYFCPEDECAHHVKEELKKAEKSILFMVFSFTHDEIGNVLLLKKADGLVVRGVMEKTQLNDFTEYGRLENNGVDVLIDGNKNNLHHKVFIIDGKTVVTGSFNPSANGDQHNDENVIVLHDTAIAAAFTQEWEKVRGEAVATSEKE
ncbi:hypothetical protein HYV86_02440 [Candidatus Woesearchaeota archaeon]|nr:hypothetical protein [Candidatus Woesearchaeota archaeon]